MDTITTPNSEILWTDYRRLTPEEQLRFVRIYKNLVKERTNYCPQIKYYATIPAAITQAGWNMWTRIHDKLAE